MVYYEDYARLKAECQARQAENSVLAVECDSIKAEVESLKRAGDELACALGAFHLLHRGKIDTTKQPDIVAWNAAKEGKQS